ncbi:hypothetical protein Tco_1291730 [Tanacetum coccineum]
MWNDLDLPDTILYSNKFAGGQCHWPATLPAQLFEEDDKDEEAVEAEAGGSSDAYQSMSRGDWQVLQEPHLQIDPFPSRETDYPLYGYTGPLPPGYDYRYSTSPDSSS